MAGVFLPGADCADDACGTGACCAGPACVMDDAYSCITAGRDFAGAGIDCAADPCGVGVGACCQGGACTAMSPEDCEISGGTSLGIGVICEVADCERGACCEGRQCRETAHYECDAADATFLEGAACQNDPCKQFDHCPTDSLFSQSRDDPDDFVAGSSEAGSPFRRSDDFFAVAGAVEALTWWGVDLEPIPGTDDFRECVETDSTFVISFLEDAGGRPGQVVCTYTLPVTRIPTGISYLGTELNEYTVDLPQPCVAVNGWISIVGLGDPTCWFLWMSAGIGDSYCSGCRPEPQGFELSFCLEGSVGDVPGACCDDTIGSCADDVDITSCLDADQRFAAGGTCSQFDPPCGVITGACCFANDTCSTEVEGDCQELGGDWLGAWTLCAHCPCITPCPAGGVAEGEPLCHDEYIDTFNGGCTSAVRSFSPIELCETICGQSGVFRRGPDFAGDFDWYEVNVATATQLRWRIDAEFPVATWIVDGNSGCGGATILAAGEAYECAPSAIAAAVQPGTYWLVVAPLGASDLAFCGARYAATVTSSSPCLGDIDGDGDLDLADYAVLADCVTGPVCEPAPCEPAVYGDPPCGLADFDGDGDVDLEDLGEFLVDFPGPE